jgi:phospholipase C
VFANTGAAAAVFHVYDRLQLAQLPRRYTVGARRQLEGVWPLAGPDTAYDLWVLGPNGLHRHFTGAAAPGPEVELVYRPASGELGVRLRNGGTRACSFELTANAYVSATPSLHAVAAGEVVTLNLPLGSSGHWYDFSLRVVGLPGFCRRFAGRMETGADSISDPAVVKSVVATGVPA